MICNLFSGTEGKTETVTAIVIEEEVGIETGIAAKIEAMEILINIMIMMR